MSNQAISNLSDHFGDLPDPRVGDNISHSLLIIITITICAVICGVDNWVEVAQFGEAKRSWFEEFLDLPHGIPSHDTIGRVFRHMNPEAFEQRFRAWTQQICEVVSGVVAIDGKQLRRSKDGQLGQNGIYMVNVWASELKLSPAQTMVDHHSVAG